MLIRIRVDTRCLASMAVSGLCVLMPVSIKCQYPGSTPSQISASVDGVTATSTQEATAQPVNVGSPVSFIVSLTLGNPGAGIGGGTGSQPISCTAYGPSVNGSLYQGTVQGSGTVSFTWTPNVAGNYTIHCSGGQGAYYVETEQISLQVN